MNGEVLLVFAPRAPDLCPSNVIYDYYVIIIVIIIDLLQWGKMEFHRSQRLKISDFLLLAAVRKIGVAQKRPGNNWRRKILPKSRSQPGLFFCHISWRMKGPQTDV